MTKQPTNTAPKPIVVKVMGENEIDKAIASITRRAKTIQEDIHSVAVSIAKVWHDATVKGTDDDNLKVADKAAERINALQGASPYHSNSFSKWVLAMLPLIWNSETKAWVSDSKHTRLMGKEFIKCRDLAFYTLAPAAQPKPMDDVEALRKLIQNQARHIEKPIDGDIISLEMHKALRSVLNKFDKEHEAQVA